MDVALVLVAGALLFRWVHHRLEIQEKRDKVEWDVVRMREQHRMSMEYLEETMRANNLHLHRMHDLSRQRMREWQELEDDGDEPWKQ